MMGKSTGNFMMILYWMMGKSVLSTIGFSHHTKSVDDTLFCMAISHFDRLFGFPGIAARGSMIRLFLSDCRPQQFDG